MMLFNKVNQPLEVHGKTLATHGEMMMMKTHATAEIMLKETLLVPFTPSLQAQ